MKKKESFNIELSLEVLKTVKPSSDSAIMIRDEIIDKYESIIKELGVLKIENEELKKRLSTSHKNEYAKCKHDYVEINGIVKYMQCLKCGGMLF